jgi:hypothetical protein
MHTPIGPGVPNVDTPVDNVPTKFRFCQDAIDWDVDCDAPTSLKNDKLREDLRPEQIVRPHPDHPWHRITLRESRDGEPKLRSDNGGHPLRYADSEPEKVLFWDYLSDWHFWNRPISERPGHNHNILAIDDRDKCSFSNMYGEGTCLNGFIWTHAATDVGVDETSHPSGDREDLSNHVFSVVPDVPTTYVCDPKRKRDKLEFYDDCYLMPDGCVGRVFVRPAECLECKKFLDVLSRDHITFPLVRTELGIVGPVIANALFGIDEIGIFGKSDVSIHDRLLRGNFVTAVEHQAPQLGQIDAIGLPLDLRSNYEHLDATPYGLDWGYAAKDKPAAMGKHTAATNASASDHPGWLYDDVRSIPSGLQRAYGRLNPKVLYSREAGAIYVVGGKSWNTGVRATEVLYQGVKTHEQRLLEGRLEDDVLAATLTQERADKLLLWTVERSTDGTYLVVRHIIGSKVSDPLRRVLLDSAERDGYRLSQSDDGFDTVLLAVNNYAERRWAVFSASSSACSTFDVCLRPIVAGDAFDKDSFLFEAPHVSGRALVLPVLRPDKVAGETFWTERFIRHSTNAPIDPKDVRSCLR